MQSTVPVQEVYNSLRTAINEYWAMSTLTKNFFLFIFNWALATIYRKHLRERSLITETYSGDAAKQFDLNYPTRRILSVINLDENTPLKRFKTKGWDEDSDYYYITETNKINFDKDVSSFEIKYYRYPNKLDDVGSNVIDLPVHMHLTLYYLIMVWVLPLFLWEWMWQLMSNFFDMANNDIMDLKKDEEMNDDVQQIQPNGFMV